MCRNHERFLTLSEIVGATRGKCLQGAADMVFRGISTDSRTIQPGELFVALEGERFDGHDFLLDALARGGKGLLGRRGSLGPIRNVAPGAAALIEVEETLHALGEIAGYWRQKHPVPLLAVTGSNGKTTTKEMAALILEPKGPVLKTEGNLNNRIGLPLMLLRLEPLHRIAVLEMGMNEPGEIRRLCRIARPQFGLITQVAPVHLAGLGSVEGVARAKGEMFRALGPRETAIVNADDPRIVEQARKCRARKITFGQLAGAMVRAVDLEPFAGEGARWTLVIEESKRPIRMKCQGFPCIQNGLAAAAAAWAMGAGMDEIEAGLSNFRPLPMRFQILPLANGVRLVDDAYNANPASMKAALETFSHLADGRMVAVLGDMRELGAYAPEAHREVGKLAADLGVQILLCVGEMAGEMAGAAGEAHRPPRHIRVLGTARQALDALLGLCERGDWILVKGSRAMSLEETVQGLVEQYGQADVRNPRTSAQRGKAPHPED